MTGRALELKRASSRSWGKAREGRRIRFAALQQRVVCVAIATLIHSLLLFAN
jgi:hypothetical protein